MATKALSKTDEKKAIANLETVCEEHNLAKLIDLPRIARALAVSDAIMAIRAGLDPLLPKFLALQNNSLGFRTDQADGYHASIVKDCIAEALLRGLPPSGNNFNIIAKRMYITKEGMLLSVSTWPGVTDVTPDVGQPAEIKTSKQKSKKGYELTILGAYMPFTCTWKLNGEDKSLETTVFCRAYAGDSAMDALQGKAYRKGLAKVLTILQGHAFSVPEGELGELDAQPVKDITPDESEKPKPKSKKDAVKERLQKAAEDEPEESEAQDGQEDEKRPPAASEGQDGANEDEEEGPKLSKEGWERIQRAGKERWPKTSKVKIDDWVAFHYGLDPMELPLYVESEILKYIKEG